MLQYDLFLVPISLVKILIIVLKNIFFIYKMSKFILLHILFKFVCFYSNIRWFMITLRSEII